MTRRQRRTITPADPHTWRPKAACQDSNPDLFDADGYTPPARISQAKDICGACPVQAACLDWALETREPVGVWGGLTESERADLLKRRSAAGRRAVIVQALAPPKPATTSTTPGKPRRPAVAGVLGSYERVLELRKAGWGQRDIAADLKTSRDSLMAAERMVAEAGSVEAALDLVVAA